MRMAMFMRASGVMERGMEKGHTSSQTEANITENLKIIKSMGKEQNIIVMDLSNIQADWKTAITTGMESVAIKTEIITKAISLMIREKVKALTFTKTAEDTKEIGKTTNVTASVF